METKLNVTKGLYEAYPATNEEYASVCLKDDNVLSVHCAHNYGANEEEGTLIAKMCAEAINTYQDTGYTPSQLLEQNRKLVEALTRINQMSDSGNYITSLLDCKKIAREAITKHSKDV